MKHELPEHLRDDLAKMLAIYYASGETGPRPFSTTPEFRAHEKARARSANHLWEKHKDGYRYTINQILEGNGQSIIP